MTTKMRVLFRTYKHLSDALEIELSRLGSKTISKGRAYCIVDESVEKIADLVYRIQIADQAIALLTEFRTESFAEFDESFSESIKDVDFAMWIDSPSYVIRCTRHGTHDFTSADIMDAARDVLAKQKLGDGSSKPVTFRFYIEDERFFFGVDLADIDMAKREWRIYPHSSSVKANIAASLAALTSTEDGRIVDPFCKDGTVCIETATWLGHTTPRRFDYEKLSIWSHKPFKDSDWRALFKDTTNNPRGEIIGCDTSNHNLSAARKNVNIAGIKDSVRLLREELEYLSLKIEEGSVDRMLSSVPSPTIKLPEKTIMKLYTKFVEAAGELLAEKSRMALVLDRPELLIKLIQEQGFKLQQNISFDMGKQPSSIIIVER